LEGVTFFSLDQAASADQGFLWHIAECGQNPNLDRHRRLRAGGDCQETFESGAQSAFDSTDFERVAIRKNADSPGAFTTGLREYQRPVS